MPTSGTANRIAIGTAGWSIPARYGAEFPGDGSHLARYARRFAVAEINSSFHRPHRAGTYARWAASVPDGFRFAVKLPKAITHVRRLVGADAELDQFAAEIAGLGDRLGPVLVQLPPKLAFDAEIARAFLVSVLGRLPVTIACEPRHPSWFEPAADTLLREYGVARVAADPAPAAGADQPGGCPDLVYCRLHGSPRTYYSAYGPDELDRLAGRLLAVTGPAWCIFDNTASGAAAGNALDLSARVVRHAG